MFVAVRTFGVLMIVMVMNTGKGILNFFSYFHLTYNQKCQYAQRKLDEEAYWWWKDSHSSCQCWFVLQDLLRTQYVLHLLFTEFRETLEDIRKGMQNTLQQKLTQSQSQNQKLQLSQSQSQQLLISPNQSQR